MRLPLVSFAALLLLATVTAPAASKGALFKGPKATLWYEVRGGGAGLPLVLVNGGPGVAHDYMLVSDVWDDLAKRRALVFYDQRGVGGSPPLAAGQSCTLADQIEDLEALRSHLGYERMDLMGHSWGGYLVMAYAARYPQHIAHLVICDSAAPKFSETAFLFKDIFPETVARQEEVAFAEELGDSAAMRSSWRDYLSMLCYSPEKRDSMLAKPSVLPTYSVSKAIWSDLSNYDLTPELAKYRFPVLVLTGRFDINVAPSVAWKIHRAVPGSRFHAFERSGHLPFYEQPTEFTRELEDFLAGR